jgi:SAM-dependent methyltransferase
MFLIHPNARDTILANIRAGSAGAEIGVWNGDFSAQILWTVRPSLLHLIDPWKCVHDDEHLDASYGANKINQEGMDEIQKRVTKRFERAINLGIVRIHPAPSTEILQKFPDESLDFVYVDGDHTHQGYLADLRASLRVVKKGGLICGGDYGQDGWWGDGIVRAVHQFVSDSPVIIDFVLGSHYAIRRL